MKGLSAHSRIKELARQFWQLEEAMRFYPIDIERAVALSDLPLIIEMLPKLSIDKVRFWIIENNYPAFFDAESKNLHGFLLARNGYGVIFVNGANNADTDPPLTVVIDPPVTVETDPGITAVIDPPFGGRI